MVDAAEDERAGGEPDAAARGEALQHYLMQRDLERQPRYRLVAASTAVWFYRELRRQVAADLRTEELDRARGMAGGLRSRKAELLEQMRHLDEIARGRHGEIARFARGPLACEDPLLQKVALCAGFHELRTAPEGSSLDAVRRLCASDELRALVALVRLDREAQYHERAARAMASLAYDLDRPYVLARSAEACLGSHRYQPYVEQELSRVPAARRARAENLLYAFRDAGGELAEAGLTPLHCDDPEVQDLIRCIVQAGVGAEMPRCKAAGAKVLLARVRWGR